MKPQTTDALLSVATGVAVGVGLGWIMSGDGERKATVGDLISVSLRSLPSVNREAMGERAQIRVLSETESTVTGHPDPVPPPMIRRGQLFEITVPRSDILGFVAPQGR